MNYTKRLIRGAGTIFVSLVLTGFLSYVVRFVLARNLTVAEFGLFYAVFAFLDTMMGFRNMGVGQALVKFIPEFLVKRNFKAIKNITIYYSFIQVLLYLVLALVLFLFAPWLSDHYFHDARAIPLLSLLLLFFFITIPENIFLAFFLGFQDMKTYALANIMKSSSLLIAILLFFHYLTPTVEIVAWAYLVSFLFSTGTYMWFFVKDYVQVIRAKFSYKPTLLKKILFFGLPLWLGILANSIVTRFDTLTLTYFRSLEEVGLYNVAFPIATLLFFISRAVALVLLPAASELSAKGHAGFGNGLHRLMYYLFVILLPMGLVLLLFPDLVITIFFGAKYVAASGALRILAIAAIIYCYASVFSEILVGLGRPKDKAVILVSGATIGVIMNLWLVPLFGIIGAAFGAMSGYLVMSILAVINVRRRVRFIVPFKKIMLTFFSGLAFILTVTIVKTYLELNVWAEATVALFLAGSLYGLLLVSFQVLPLKEVKELIRVVLA